MSVSLFNRAAQINLSAYRYVHPQPLFSSTGTRCYVCDEKKYVTVFSAKGRAVKSKFPCILCNRSASQSAEEFALQKLGLLFDEKVKEAAMTFKSTNDLETIAAFCKKQDNHCTLPEGEVYASQHPNLCKTYYFSDHLDDFDTLYACIKRLARTTKRYLKAPARSN